MDMDKAFFSGREIKHKFQKNKMTNIHVHQAFYRIYLAMYLEIEEKRLLHRFLCCKLLIIDLACI